MILYKYLSFNVGLRALIRNTVRFTPPSELNDPFDTVAFQSHPDFTDLTQRIANDSYGVLSLSRSPTNPVIWSHYGHGPVIEKKYCIPVYRGTAHRGIVIGIDMTIAGFDSDEENVLPAKFGNVIYTSTKPDLNLLTENPLTFSFENGRIQNFHADLLEQIQRKFLYKSTGWAYEEEVRIIKNIQPVYFRHGDKRNSERRGIYLLPTNSIKEVYFGCMTARYPEIFRKIRRLKSIHTDANFYFLEENTEDWTLNPAQIDN